MAGSRAFISAIKGGVNLVRVRHAGPTDVIAPRTQGLTWDVTWDVTWEHATGTPVDNGDFPKIRVSNLVASKTCARAGEFISYDGQTYRLLTDLVANASGIGITTVDRQVNGTTTRPVSMGAERESVCEVTEIPEINYTFASDQTVTWRFLEVRDVEFSDVENITLW